MINPAPEIANGVLTIDLGAIRHNYRLLKNRLGPTACAGVVKADAYGLGAAEVATALMKEGCDTFFVAYLSEGLDLREQIGSTPTIYVLNGLPPGGETAAADADLRPVLNSLDQLAAWRRTAHQLSAPLPAAIQVDSGMSRMGLAPSEVETLFAEPDLLNGVDVTLVMSHLACADEHDNPANAEQLAAFNALRAKLPTAPASFSNSSAVFLDPAYHFDLARPGVALYGVNPTPGAINPMRPVVRLDIKVVQTRDVGDGVGIGYGYAARARENMRLATISLGYADGWPRRVGAAAFWGDVRLPFAGRVSMDSIILDISALPPGKLMTGDLVEVIGPHQDIDAVAALAQTIGYEILTSLGHRFHRVYVDG